MIIRTLLTNPAHRHPHYLRVTNGFGNQTRSIESKPAAYNKQVEMLTMHFGEPGDIWIEYLGDFHFDRLEHAVAASLFL